MFEEKILDCPWEEFEEKIKKAIGSDFIWKIRPGDTEANRQAVMESIERMLGEHNGSFPAPLPRKVKHYDKNADPSKMEVHNRRSLKSSFLCMQPFPYFFDSLCISRFVMTLSTIPYFKASSLFMKKSRSVSSRIFSMGCPVCWARMRWMVSLTFNISLA